MRTAMSYKKELILTPQNFIISSVSIKQNLFLIIKKVYNGFQSKSNTLFFKENRIYIRREFRGSLGMIFFSPFQPESVQIM